MNFNAEPNTAKKTVAFWLGIIAQRDLFNNAPLQ